ncbi:MAG: adenosylcobinamide-phosphate synthase CbiB [Phenylobacterium sp.]|uniref:adenosylcobinamide-phosphate synthase CbiB n=1 Tax=Phenylobacterium sp. TaxID=1871053 RepID=UPI00273263AA|nr:adenosylcobinamide-phosphate synthase CbiB [Phenylobacterium sp.]MDP3747106.1 adenosylcobinamide-phosphate synthase CbiB [Phenylobacterium sp.]
MAADPWLVLGAAAIEAAVGYPRRLHAVVPHPVAWTGWALRGLDRTFNRGGDFGRRLAGLATLLIVVGAAGGVGYALDRALTGWGLVLAALVGSLGLAARSLYDHVGAVRRALAADDLEAARAAVGMIVGRDTAGLDRQGVAAAALESLAESFNDGVVAPLFWFLVAGLAGLFAYKAVNTADSVIGHREAPYRDFGWAAARTDDLMNLIPARIAGALIALVAGRGWATMFRDAPRHASPNAGWPEAAMAGALGVRLGGVATYDGVAYQRPTFGDGAPPSPRDLRRGLGLYLRACGLLAAGLALGGFAWPR